MVEKEDKGRSRAQSDISADLDLENLD